MVRAVPLLLALVLALVIVGWVARWVRGDAAAWPRRRGSRRSGSYEFDRRTDQARRRLKSVRAPAERREDIVAFLDAHEGVEAYVEPKTVISSMSVVLVDGAGEWRRFELAEDVFLRRLAAERGVPIFDASLTGYPPRMRRRPPSG